MADNFSPQLVSESEAAARITAAIQKIAAHTPVVFLLSGGSAADLGGKIVQALDASPVADTITIGQVDERFGLPGHADANWPKLAAAMGSVQRVMLQPMLTGASLEETVQSYEEFLHGKTLIGLFGVGTDAHTAGILPGSKAAAEEERWVVGYQANDFTRITITPPCIAQMSHAFLSASGEAKRQVITSLQKEADPQSEPVQFLKTVPNLSIFYSENS